MSDLPTPQELATLLRGLLGRDVKASACTGALRRLEAGAVAEYVNPAGQPLAWWALEFECAAGLGAALSLLATAVIAEAVRLKTLNESLLENLHEVLNVGARLFVDKGQVVTLGHLHVGPAARDALAHVPATARSVDIDIIVSGYAKGRVRLSSLPS